MKQVMRRMGLDTKQLTPRTVLGRISWAKNHMVDPQDYYLGSKDPDSERIAHIFKGYQGELRKNNALDFDDLLLEAVAAAESFRRTSECYQRRYRYLLVDEYQDTNRPQYELMKLLAGETQKRVRCWRRGSEHLFVARRRYSQHPGVRKGFSERAHHQARAELSIDADHFEAAGAVVANNLRRKGKQLWTDRPGRLADWILRSAGWRK